MRFRWNWLEPVMPVSYVPTLGPVHPGNPLPDLFNAVAEAAGTDRFLPHDKDHRWSDRKTEQVLVDAIQHHLRQTLVPTLQYCGARTVRVHTYTSDLEGLATASELARQLATSTARSGPRSYRSSPRSSAPVLTRPLISNCPSFITPEGFVAPAITVAHRDVHHTLLAGLRQCTAQCDRDRPPGRAELHQYWFQELASDDTRNIAAEHRAIAELTVARNEVGTTQAHPVEGAPDPSRMSRACPGPGAGAPPRLRCGAEAFLPRRVTT
ncbi:hypothetical protein [Streptomyces sp. NPDC004324]